jgi:hypothetical protein
VPLNQRLKLTIDYRYLSVQNLDLNTVSGVGVDADYDDHAIFVGLRFALNPPPKPAPAPRRGRSPNRRSRHRRPRHLPLPRSLCATSSSSSTGTAPS